MKDRKNIGKIMSLLLLTTFLFVNSSSASEQGITLTISNGTVSAQWYLTMDNPIGKLSVPSVLNFNELLPINISCQNVTTINDLNQTISSQVCNTSVSYTKDIAINLNSNASASNQNWVPMKDYIECITLQEQYKQGLTTNFVACNAQTMYKDNYTQCSTDLQICNADKSRITTDKITAETNFNDSKNAKYYFGVGGLILGIAGYMFYRKEIGGSKRTQQDSYNAHQAG